MYTNTKAKVVSPDGETDLFDITAGVLQGDTLAPFLFVIVLDYAMRKAMAGSEEELGFTITPRKSRRHPKEVIADLDFADDISLLSDEMIQAQKLLLNVESECKKVGLGLNGPKTKFLAYNVEVQQPLHTMDGTALEQKDDFKYLGSWADCSERDIDNRYKESSCLEGNQRHDKSMEIHHEHRAQKEILCRHCRVHPIIRMRSMDTHKTNGDSTRWYLHQNAKKSPQHTLE